MQDTSQHGTIDFRMSRCDKTGKVLAWFLLLAGLACVALSSTQSSTHWIGGSYWEGTVLVNWDGLDIQILPTFHLLQAFGIELVCGGIIVLMVAQGSKSRPILAQLAMVITLVALVYVAFGFGSWPPGVTYPVVIPFWLLVILGSFSLKEILHRTE